MGQRNPGENEQFMRQVLSAIRAVLRSGRTLSWMALYSILCAGLIFLTVPLIDKLSSLLVFSGEHAALTSGDYRFFFTSWQGYVFLILVAAILLLGISLLIIIAIFLSEDLLHGRPVMPVSLFVRSIRSLRLFRNRSSIPLILYYLAFDLVFVLTLLLLLPDPFEIPGFLRYLLGKNPLYLCLYILLLLLISVPQVRNPLLLRACLMEKHTPKMEAERTRMMVRRNRTLVYPAFLSGTLFFSLNILLTYLFFLYFPLLVQKLSFRLLPLTASRFCVLLSVYYGCAVLIVSLLFSPWILPLTMSCLYDLLSKREETKGDNAQVRLSEEMKGMEGREKTGNSLNTERDGNVVTAPLPLFRSSRRRRIICAVIIAAVLFAVLIPLSLYSTKHFEAIYPRARNVEAVVHRLGGFMDVENTLEGQQKAIDAGALAAETDIQRTKDGEYVIFHDSTLKRMCGTNQKIFDMTLEEVRNVEIPALDGEVRHIPTLREVLHLAKGKMRLYLEMKGVTADEQMADDIIAMIREEGMADDCVLISMNYHLIQYIEKNYENIECGYLYFFAYGAAQNLDCDMLLAQANAINPGRTRSSRLKGKKIYCWTINKKATALKMLRYKVDGMISDRYDIIASVLDHMESRTDYERIMDVLLA